MQNLSSADPVLVNRNLPFVMFEVSKVYNKGVCKKLIVSQITVTACSETLDPKSNKHRITFTDERSETFHGFLEEFYETREQAYADNQQYLSMPNM